MTLDYIAFPNGYMDVAFGDPGALTRRFDHELPSLPEFDTLVGTGLSGTLVVPLLARHAGKFWAIVRKEGDGSHSSNKIEGRLGTRYLFVDDVISTGTTKNFVIDSVIRAVENHNRWALVKSTCAYVGNYLYSPEST